MSAGASVRDPAARDASGSRAGAVTVCGPRTLLDLRPTVQLSKNSKVVVSPKGGLEVWYEFPIGGTLLPVRGRDGRRPPDWWRFFFLDVAKRSAVKKKNEAMGDTNSHHRFHDPIANTACDAEVIRTYNQIHANGAVQNENCEWYKTNTLAAVNTLVSCTSERKQNMESELKSFDCSATYRHVWVILGRDQPNKRLVFWMNRQVQAGSTGRFSNEQMSWQLVNQKGLPRTVLDTLHWLAGDIAEHVFERHSSSGKWESIAGHTPLKKPEQHLSPLFKDTGSGYVRSVLVSVVTPQRGTTVYVVLQESNNGSRCVLYVADTMHNHSNAWPSVWQNVAPNAKAMRELIDHEMKELKFWYAHTTGRPDLLRAGQRATEPAGIIRPRQA